MSFIYFKTAASDCAQTLHNITDSCLGQLWLFHFSSSLQSGRLWRMIVHQVMCSRQISCRRSMCVQLCWMQAWIMWVQSEKTPLVQVLLDVLKAGQLWFGSRCWLEQGGLKNFQYASWKLICSSRSLSWVSLHEHQEEKHEGVTFTSKQLR